jgi:hypothetical protein
MDDELLGLDGEEEHQIAREQPGLNAKRNGFVTEHGLEGIVNGNCNITAATMLRWQVLVLHLGASAWASEAFLPTVPST